MNAEIIVIQGLNMADLNDLIWAWTVLAKIGIVASLIGGFAYLVLFLIAILD